MLLSIWIALAHAGCAGGVCPPIEPADAEATMPVTATAPVPVIDQDRPDDIRTVVFALG